jgi:hypothetical protein
LKLFVAPSFWRFTDSEIGWTMIRKLINQVVDAIAAPQAAATGSEARDAAISGSA